MVAGPPYLLHGLESGILQQFDVPGRSQRPGYAIRPGIAAGSLGLRRQADHVGELQPGQGGGFNPMGMMKKMMEKMMSGMMRRRIGRA